VEDRGSIPKRTATLPAISRDLFKFLWAHLRINHHEGPRSTTSSIFPAHHSPLPYVSPMHTLNTHHNATVTNNTTSEISEIEGASLRNLPTKHSRERATGDVQGKQHCSCGATQLTFRPTTACSRSTEQVVRSLVTSCLLNAWNATQWNGRRLDLHDSHVQTDIYQYVTIRWWQILLLCRSCKLRKSLSTPLQRPSYVPLSLFVF
jgi:hypothetical protein